MFLLVVGVLLTLLLFVLIAISYSWRPPTFDLTGAHILITGGSSGIGKFVAIRAASMGAKVTLVARNVERLEAAKSEVEAVARQQVEIISVDVCNNFPDVEKAINMAVERQGPVDVLVNSAGLGTSATFEDTEPEEFERLMKINYLGSVYPTKCVVASMKERQKGRIVFVSSQAGQAGIYGFSAYSPTKFALHGLAQVLQMELLPYNVYVSVSCPPDTDTPGFRKEVEQQLEVTKVISNTSGVFTAENVAETIIDGLRRGDYHIWNGLEGWMLAQLTAGMSPVHRLESALVQILSMSVLRAVCLFYISQFNRVIRRHKTKTD